MKFFILFISLLWASIAIATPNQLTTRFGILDIKESKGPKFSVQYKGKVLLGLEALTVSQEATFRFSSQDIILLRFTQGTNSHHDMLAFVSINQKQMVKVSDAFPFPAGVRADVSQRDESVVLDLGVERNTRTFALYDGNSLEMVKKGVSNTERFAEPLPEQDCSKIYNSLYLRAFGLEQCQGVSQMITQSFVGTVTYGAMLKRSHALSMDKLIGVADKTCQTKSVLPYNDFKAGICGYATVNHPMPSKNFAKTDKP